MSGFDGERFDGFADLPAHWRCPNCDCDAEQFLLLGD